MSKKSNAALDRDPPGDGVPAQLRERPTTPSSEQVRPHRKRGAVKRKRATFHVSTEVLDRARNAVFWLSGPPERLTLGRLVERALIDYLKRLEKEHNKGKPFEERHEELRGGRPVVL